MADDPKQSIYITHKNSSLPDVDEEIRCPDHDVEPEIGFGLAGGGYGIYTYCPECGCILSKTDEDTDETA